MAEPLVNNWYAWSHLIAPATSSMIMANRHIKLLKSYLNSPSTHSDAAKNPKLKGGFFVDMKNGVENVSALIQKLLDNKNQFLLADAIKDLIVMIDGEGREECGSLLSLYQQLPLELKGYIELSYNINNAPTFRFFESLLYKSKYYFEESQTVLLSLLSNDTRPFVLSTPRFGTKNDIHIQQPFRSIFYDELFSMRHSPQSMNYISSLFDMAGISINEILLQLFFTDECPAKNDTNIKNQKLDIKYFGHACVLVQAKEVSILVDPFIGYQLEGGNTLPRYSFSDLPEKIDYVLITHAHQDHFVIETLLQLRHKIHNIVVPRNLIGALQDPSLGLLLKNIGFKNIIQMEELEEILFPQGKIVAIPFMGEHGDLNIQSKLAYVLTINNNAILFAADSNNIDSQMYSHIQQIIGDIEVAFIGMECEGAPASWLYGPIMAKPLSKYANESRRLNGSDAEAAFDIVKQFKCKRAYIYAMGMEPWIRYISSIDEDENTKPVIEAKKFVKLCENNGVLAKRLYGQELIQL